MQARTTSERKLASIVRGRSNRHRSTIAKEVSRSQTRFLERPANAYVEKLIPLLSLPRNWIIGPQGVISYEQHGYYVEPEQWLTRRVIERMESLK